MTKHSRVGDPESREEMIERAFFHLWSAPSDLISYLVAGQFRRQFVDKIRREGVIVHPWNRWSSGQIQGEPWPKTSAVSAAILRLPKSKGELEFSLKAIQSQLNPGQPLWVIGANDEGIKSAAKAMEPLFEDVRTVGSKHHCRLLVCHGRTKSTSFQLHDLEVSKTLALRGTPVKWKIMPGVFAKGALDPATALLMDVLPELRPPTKVLDFACGTGPIARAVQDHFPTVELTMTDADSIAIHVARKNVPEATGIISDGWANIPDGFYDLIMSNPPIHWGKSEDHRVLDELISNSTQRLTPGGQLVLVGQGRLHLGRRLGTHFARPVCLRRTPRFQVWSSR